MTTPQHPIAAGARVYHAAQQWGYRYPEGTAVVLSCQEGPPGHWEYRVRTGRDFSRPPGPDNPEDRESSWPGWAVRTADDAVRLRYEEIMARVNALTPEERAASVRRTEEELAAWRPETYGGQPVGGEASRSEVTPDTQ